MGTKSSLKALFVQKTRDIGKHHDGQGHGLYLCVSETGNKTWEQRITVNGRRRTLGLGRYPDVSLKAARQQALRNRLLANDGVDPLAKKRADRPMPTFAEAAEEVIKIRRSKWTAKQMERRWRRSLEMYAYPELRTLRVCDIEAPHVVAVLKAVHTRAPKLVLRVGQQISAVLSWAVGCGYRRHNPCGSALEALLQGGALPAKRHRALPYQEVASALARVRGATDDWIGTRLLFQFLVLTAVRTNEARGAQWSEIDFSTAKWTVPAGRMKERSEHSVPLSSTALGVLREARAHHDLAQARQRGENPQLVFVAKRGGESHNNALSKFLKKLQIAASPHGFRSSFRTWATDTRVPFDIAETCLAHAVGTSVSRLYERTERFDPRVPVMEDWGRYVAPARSVSSRRPLPVRAAHGGVSGSFDCCVSFIANAHGRDFVVGDVHGCFRTLERALDVLGFEQGRDRLFGVGDLVNRGPHSDEAVEWLDRRFDAVAIGNHDRAVLRWFESNSGTPPPPGSEWLSAISPGDHPRWRAALARLSLAVTIETPHDPVGIVHAEAPDPVWARATALLETGDASVIDIALLGVAASDESDRRPRSQPVEGLRALVHGHEPGRKVRHSANCWNIDTGAGIEGFNRLSLLEVNAPKLHAWTFDVDESA